MSTKPTLSEEQIRDWTDGRSFSRGLDYFRNGAIKHPRRDGMTLKAECQGSAPRPYRVEMTLNDTGVSSGFCSCPVGHGGHCKHGVALLLTWLHSPESFTESVSQKRSLEERSREELIQLIIQMIDRYPDLETLLEMPAPGAGQRGETVDPAVIRAQLSDALEADDDGQWGYGVVDTSKLFLVAEQGDAYAAAGDWRNAATVYATVALEILDSYEELYDDEGEYLMVVDKCAADLIQCLRNLNGPEDRLDILETLYSIYRWDIDAGGVGAGDEAYVGLIEESSAGEKNAVAQWVRQDLAQIGDHGSTWRRQAFGGFLLTLEMDEMDDEAYLSVCRETGRTLDLVKRLLDLERVDEAATEAANASDWDLTRMADIFHATGHGDVVARIIESRPVNERDLRPLAWLLTYRRETGDLSGALAVAQQIFERQEWLENYRTVRDIAQEAGLLEEVTAPILRQLAADQKYRLLTEIYLSEGEIDRALAAFAQAEAHEQQGFGRVGLANLRLRVAGAAEKERPDAAIPIYVRTVEQLIAARGRDNYRQAAAYLMRLQSLYRQMDREAEFAALALRLREENRNLPAMKDEFNRAGVPGRV